MEECNGSRDSVLKEESNGSNKRMKNSVMDVEPE